MSNTNLSTLLPLKIKINCSNDIAYMDCAYLLDQPEFLRKLKILRKEFGINKLVPYKNFTNWKTTQIKEDLKAWSTNNQKLVKKFIRKHDRKHSTTELFKSLPIHKQFQWQSELLCREFNRPGYFDLVIQYAIVCGEVGDESYQHTRIDVIPHDLSGDLPFPEVAIIITPVTTMKDIKHIFETNLPQVFEDNKHLLKYYSQMKKSKSSNIRQIRDWYWRNVSGEGYTAIALSVTTQSIRNAYMNQRNRYLIPEYKSIDQSIRRYKKTLKTYK